MLCLTGADIVLHSVTKYIGGHSDVLMGALVTSDDDIHEKLRFIQKAVGAVPSPFDCYLALRGLYTCICVYISMYIVYCILYAMFLLLLSILSSIDSVYVSLYISLYVSV